MVKVTIEGGDLWSVDEDGRLKSDFTVS